jgi:MFS family permease
MQIRFSQRWTIFFISSALFILSQFYRATIAVITPQLIADLSLDTRALSLMSAAFFYAFALTQIPLAVYLDKIGARTTMIFLNLVAVAGALVFAGADSSQMLILARLLLGIGMACNLMGTFKLISLWFDPLRFATLTTLVFSLGTAGSVFATTPLVLLVQAIGWRCAFILFAAINLGLIAVFFATVRDKPPDTRQPEGSGAESKGFKDMLAGLGRVLQQKDYWIISLGTFCRYGIYAAIQTLYAGPYLMNARGFSPLVAGNIIFLMNLGFIMGGPFFGMVSDRLARTRKWVVLPGIVGMAVMIGVFAVLPPTTGPNVLALLFFLLGLITSAGGIMYSQIKEQVPIENAGAAMIGINFFTMVGSAVFLQGMGIFMQSTYPAAPMGMPAFRGTFVLCAACLLLVAVIYIFTTDTGRGKDS